MDWPTILVAGAFGAFVGSFLNVCVYRLPRNQSVVTPPSRCLSCGTRLPWYDNLPLVGWLLLRGRCRWCGTRYGARYVLMEVAVAALTALVCWRVLGEPRAYAAGWIVDAVGGGAREGAAFARGVAVAEGCAIAALLTFVWYLFVSALIDLEHLIIPDELTKSLQLAAPWLATCSALVHAFDTRELSLSTWRWLRRASVFGDGGYDVARFGIRFGAIVAATLGLLALSVPLARWVYDRYVAAHERWDEGHHRDFRIGAYWFIAATIPAAVGAIACAGVAPRFAATLADAVLGALVGWMALYLVGLIGTVVFRRSAMGFGDVKFLAPVGAFLGPIGVVYAFFLAAICGSLVGLPMRLLKREVLIPFGPYLALGSLLAAAFGPALNALLLGR